MHDKRRTWVARMVKVPRLNISTSLHTSALGERHVVTLNGELDVASAPLLERTLEELCSSAPKAIVVDLGGVEFIDSSGMNAILRSKMLCEEHECSFSLTPARPAAQRVFEITRVLDKLPFRSPRHKPSAPGPFSTGQAELEIRDDASGERHTLVLAGQLDTTTSVGLERVMVAVCKAGATEIVLDLRQLDFLDSTGVRAIVRSQERCREHDCDFFLTPGRHAIERMFDEIGLSRDSPLSRGSQSVEGLR
jgi:anti-sigma B factor antagonist